MRLALFIVLLCAVADLVVCTILLGVVWVAHGRVRREAAAEGNPLPSAAGQFGCLITFGLLGVAVLCGAAWVLLETG